MSGWSFQSCEKVQSGPLAQDPFMKYLHVIQLMFSTDRHKFVSCNELHLHKTLVVEVAIEYNTRSKG